ncbi:MAG: PE-PPE domain-containing protein [Actinomycetia bacterium]|nr:PE-PPE domain-containing protein [Actinomycetes bacterium]
MAAGAIAAPQAALAANVRTIEGYTAGGKLDWDMSEIFQGAYCSAESGNTCTPVEYLSGTPVVGEFSGLTALTVALWLAPSPTTVVGFSQGSVVATEWLRVNEGRWGAPSEEDLTFVLVANPLRKHGGVRPVYDIDEPTPDSRYGILDIAIEYDGVADVPDNLFNLLAVANALAGAQHVHIYGYSDVDLANSEKLVWQEGDTTYVLIRNENIPLLQPLRDIGLGSLADLINDPLKAIIDSGYDRNYSGLVDPADHAEALQQFSSLDTGPSAAAAIADPPSPAAAESAQQQAEPNLPGAAASSQTPESSEPPAAELKAEDPSTQPAAEDPAAADPTAEDPTAWDSTAEDPTAEDPTAWDQAATAETDEQSLDGETETSTADADIESEIESDIESEIESDIESEIQKEENDTAPNAERSGNGSDAGSESTSESDETGSSHGADADGQDSASAAPSGESNSTSESSDE